MRFVIWMTFASILKKKKVDLFNKARLLCCWKGAMKRIRKQFVLEMK